MKARNLLAPLAAAAAATITARALLRRTRRIDLRGKKVLVTGGSRGLGFAAARAFVREGADVLIALRADVADEAAAQALVRDAIEHLGCIDVFVSCAVEIGIGPLESLTASDFEQAFRGVFFATYHPMMAVVPHMRARGFGRIVNLASVGGKVPLPHSATYCVGKFALTALSETASIELAKHGIRVSTVTPPPLRNGAWLNGFYSGNAEEELAWFAGALSTRLTSIDTERAARTIVDCARYGDIESAVAPMAWLQPRMHGLAPNLTVALSRRADAALPAPGADRAVRASTVLANTTSGHVTATAHAGKADAVRYLQPVADVID